MPTAHMHKFLLVIVGICFCSGAIAAPAAVDVAAMLDKAIAGQHRSDKNKARDIYRHPKETLLFFGLKPNMTVVEVWPGGGWYTEILAPVLRDNGKFYSAIFPTNTKGAPDYRKKVVADYRAMLDKAPQIYDKVQITELEAPEHTTIAPPESADMVLTFRNVHNWAANNTDADTFKAFYKALKRGGILGVVEHRAKDNTTMADMTRTGYMTEAYVIKLAEQAGFKLAGKSEINANPKDTKDYAKGVWTLPPTLRLGEQDRAKYSEIGESDRMTLKFVKP